MSKLTAPFRTKLSTPMRFLQKFIRGDCLDYGCGRGFDCDALGIGGYDPYWDRPMIEKKKYDVIFCNFVLNVVTEKVQKDIINHIEYLLRYRGGEAFFTVRRDFKDQIQGIGCIQRNVVLPFESIKYLSHSYEIYRFDPHIEYDYSKPITRRKVFNGQKS